MNFSLGFPNLTGVSRLRETWRTGAFSVKRFARRCCAAFSMLFSMSAAAQAATVDVSVNWPVSATENLVAIFDGSGALLHLLDSAGAPSFKTTQSYTLPDGERYIFLMRDAGLNTWAGGSAFVTVDGTQVIASGGPGNGAQDAQINFGTVGPPISGDVTVCAKVGSEVDMQVGLNANSLAKLQNSAYFGPSGSVAPETIGFQQLATVTGATLSSGGCDIYLGGGDVALTTPEADAVHTWLSGGNRYMIGACDYTFNPLCSRLRTNFDIANGGVSIDSLLSYNPLACGGALGVDTFGGVSSYFQTQGTDVVLGTHNAAGNPPAVITDTVNGGSFIMLPDADMLGSSGSGAIGAGGTANSNQALLVLNTFKLALDELAGRTVQQCVADYNNAPGTISGYVYSDADGNDSFASGTEVGLPDITVRLYGDPGTPTNPNDDLLQSTVETDANGFYSFNANSSLTFRIEVDETDAEIPSEATAGTTNPLTGVTVATGGTTDNQNFGFDELSSGPPFPPGPGLMASVCEVAPATDPWQDIGLRWEFNAGSPAGTSPDAVISNPSIFASATVGTYVGVNAQINGFDLNIDADSIPASYDDTKYIQYQFTTAAFGTNAELTGAGWTLFEAEQPGHDQDTGAYSFTILIDDDPSFGSPEVWFNEMSFDGVDDSAAAASTGVSYPGNYAQNFAHFDPTGTTITLSPSTTYTIRVYPYGVTRFGDDNGQPFTNIVLWDDFMPKAVSCAATKDRSDAPVAGVAPDGGSTIAYGEALHTVTAGLQLGSAIDAEGAAVANADASGDGDDDDSISSFPALEVGSSGYTLPASNITATGSGTLHGWIDFDGDGTFEASEHTSVDVTSGTLAGDLTWTSAVTNTPMTSFARFRLTSDALSSAGFATTASDGEVEDYQITISAKPSSTSNTSLGQACVAAGGSLGATNLFTDLDGGTFGFGSGAIDEIPATDDFGAQISGGVFINNFTGFGHGNYTYISNHRNRRNDDQYDGIYYDPVHGINGRFLISDPNTSAPTFSSQLSGLVPGVSYEVSFWAADSETSVSGFKNRMGVFVDGNQIYDTGLIVGNGTTLEWNKYSTIYTHTSSATSADIEIRSLETGATGRDFFFDEIRVYGCVLPIDFSDAPADGSSAPDGVSSTAYGEAKHIIATGTSLGTLVDGETVSIASPNASDDGEDDDGVSLPTPLMPGSTVAVPISVNGSGFLNAWIDWNGNGVFDGIEQVAVDVQDVSGSGTISLPVSVPVDARAGMTFARFRWSSAFDIGSSGVAVDGEVEDYQVTIGGGATMLSGQIFIDNGEGSGGAHNGLIAGDEQAGAFGSIALLDGSGNPLATATVNPDGTWNGTLPAGYSGSVQVVTTPLPGYRAISEDRSTLPGVVNTSETDGSYTFNVTAGTSYSGMNIGVIADPTLTQNQTASVVPGQSIDLAHIYTATTSGTVTFALVDQIANPAEAFTSTLFEDTDCDGAPDQVPASPKAVSVGQQVCLVVSTQASAGAGPDASHSYGLTATTAFTGTTVTHDVRNDDAIGAGSGQELVLRKMVTNLTKVSGEGTTNTGDVGDILRYRIVMSNPSGAAAADVVVYDETPAYTALNVPAPSPITLANGVTCALAVPASNVAGYSGPLQWNCPGSFPAGGEGSITFDVRISP